MSHFGEVVHIHMMSNPTTSGAVCAFVLYANPLRGPLFLPRQLWFFSHNNNREYVVLARTEVGHLKHKNWTIFIKNLFISTQIYPCYSVSLWTSPRIPPHQEGDPMLRTGVGVKWRGIFLVEHLVRKIQSHFLPRFLRIFPNFPADFFPPEFIIFLKD